MSIDLPGFADPVLGAQSAFRSILEAMSRPGTLHTAGVGLTPPAPLAPATAAALLTLCDAETKLHLGAGCEAARDWIAFHCGAPLVDEIGLAEFALALAMPDLTTLSDGSDDAPQDSATLVLQVDGFGRGQSLHLAGPGLRVPGVLKVAGLPAHFAAAWAANHAKFPRGVDLILCAGTEIAALPRTVRIAVHEMEG
jgi:alpha-D-ribose 1-methylphosphonate 5-triphosphate synthase subunit PhnH